jgi:hypothetical protein
MPAVAWWGGLVARGFIPSERRIRGLVRAARRWALVRSRGAQPLVKELAILKTGSPACGIGRGVVSLHRITPAEIICDAARQQCQKLPPPEIPPSSRPERQMGWTLQADFGKVRDHRRKGFAMRWANAMSCRRLLHLLVLLGGVLCSCRSWDTAEPGADTPHDAAWSAHMREPTSPGHQLGIDRRAREIEGNLGVR